MTPREDLIGQKFKNWTVLEYAGKSRWLIQCACGFTRTLRGSDLKNKVSYSCGCLAWQERMTKIGDVYNSWTVIDCPVEDNKRAICKCECGTIRNVLVRSLRNGISKSCGCSRDKKSKIQIGAIFNEWTVLEKRGSTNGGHRYWLCKCSCGVEREVDNSELLKGDSKSCGHNQFKKKDGISVGDVFNEWTIVEDLMGSEWKAVCSCGEIGIHKGYEFKSGLRKSCGHLNRFIISPNDVFDRLTVIKETKSVDGQRKYLCKCSCGKETIVSSGNLRTGMTRSCGCLIREITSKRASEMLSNNSNIFSRYKWYFLDKQEISHRCKSSYEVFVWNYYCHILNEEIEYEPTLFKISESRRYRPDFYLPKYNQYLEPKGTWYFSLHAERQKENIEELSKTENIRVLFWKDIQELCGLKYSSYDTYTRHAEKLGVSREDYHAKMMYYDENPIPS